MTRTCSIRPSVTAREIDPKGSVPTQPTIAGSPLTSATSIRRPGRSPPFSAMPTRKRATLSAPVIGRRAAEALPPPSLIRTTSGASAASNASTSPPATAAKNRSVTSRWACRSASNRGCRACTCSRARCVIWRTAASLRPRAAATSATDSPKASAARRPPARPGSGSRGRRAGRATPARRARRPRPAPATAERRRPGRRRSAGARAATARRSSRGGPRGAQPVEGEPAGDPHQVGTRRRRSSPRSAADHRSHASWTTSSASATLPSIW